MGFRKSARRRWQRDSSHSQKEIARPRTPASTTFCHVGVQGGRLLPAHDLLVLVAAGTRLAPIWSNVTATELYDHRGAAPYPTDFDASENENVAANASHAAVVAELGARLRAMFP